MHFLFVFFFLTCQVRYRKGALHLVRLCLSLANIQKIEKPCLKEITSGLMWSLKCQHETWKLLFHAVFTIRYQGFRSFQFQIEKEGLEPQDIHLNSFTCNLLPRSGSQSLRVCGQHQQAPTGKSLHCSAECDKRCSLFSFKGKADKHLQD